jgi:hypothetical protein
MESAGIKIESRVIPDLLSNLALLSESAKLILKILSLGVIITWLVSPNHPALKYVLRNQNFSTNLCNQ